MSWKIDSAHSEINFAARHMMISTVRGRFEKFEGTVDFDENKLENSKVDVTIDASSLSTREPQRDGHLRSPDFLDVENYPVMRFVSRRVEVLNKTRGRVYGDLTIKNETRPVVLDVEFNGLSKSPWGKTVAGFDAHAKLNRKDWGLTWNVALETGGWLVGDELKVDVTVELIKQDESEAVPQEAVAAAD
jgi:polyisoprenoid-binding protein YceI